MNTLIAQQNDTLDRLIFRHYNETAGLVEIALDYNPELANMPILPMGYIVTMPDDDEMPIVAHKQDINLWD